MTHIGTPLPASASTDSDAEDHDWDFRLLWPLEPHTEDTVFNCLNLAAVRDGIPGLLDTAQALSSALSAVTERLTSMPDSAQGDELRRLWSRWKSCDGALVAFCRALDQQISVSVTRGQAGKTLLKVGSTAWKRKMKVTYSAILEAVLSPEARMELWRASVSGRDDTLAAELSGPSRLLSAMLAVELVPRLLAAKAANALKAAVPVPPVESVPPVEALGSQGARVHPTVREVVEVDARLKFHDIEATELEYILGWVIFRLRQLRHIVFRADHPGAAHKKHNEQAVKFIQECLNEGDGADISSSLRMGPQQRLVLPHPELVTFLLRFESFLRSFLLTPRRLLLLNAELPRETLRYLSTSPYLRRIWGEAVTAICDKCGFAVLPPTVSVAVLQQFVMIYMRSRFKTLRTVSGLVAESSLAHALRKGLKTHKSVSSEQKALWALVAASTARAAKREKELAALAAREAETPVPGREVVLSLKDNKHGYRFRLCTCRCKNAATLVCVSAKSSSWENTPGIGGPAEKDDVVLNVVGSERQSLRGSGRSRKRERGADGTEPAYLAQEKLVDGSGTALAGKYPVVVTLWRGYAAPCVCEFLDGKATLLSPPK